MPVIVNLLITKLTCSLRITGIYVISAALSALAWSAGAGAGTLNLHTQTPTVKVAPPTIDMSWT